MKCFEIKTIGLPQYAIADDMASVVKKYPDARSIVLLGNVNVLNTEPLAKDPGEPEWIVNSLGELGVKVGDRFFFLYKGHNLEYTNDSAPMLWRPVLKREFGETCRPADTPFYDRGEVNKDGSYTFGVGWKSLTDPKEEEKDDTISTIVKSCRARILNGDVASAVEYYSKKTSASTRLASESIDNLIQELKAEGKLK